MFWLLLNRWRRIILQFFCLFVLFFCCNSPFWDFCAVKRVHRRCNCFWLFFFHVIYNLKSPWFCKVKFSFLFFSLKTLFELNVSDHVYWLSYHNLCRFKITKLLKKISSLSCNNSKYQDLISQHFYDNISLVFFFVFDSMSVYLLSA